MARVVTLLVAALFTGILTAEQLADAARVLADMRRALGGDALADVRGFSVEGIEILGDSNDIERGINLKWVCIIPDLFVQTRSIKNQFADFATTTGFEWNQPVLVAKGNLLGMHPPAPPAGGSDDEVAGRQGAVTAAKQQFSRYAIAMLGATSAYPLDATYIGTDALDGKAVHVLELTATDGYRSRLYVDTKTNLPRMISWMAAQPMDPARARPDQAAGVPLVERRIFFSDFKKADGLNWPHRFREVVGRITLVDTRLGKFKINP